MTLINTNSIFTPITKFIKFSGSDMVVVSGANVIGSLPLCGVKIDYEQYLRTLIQIPAGQEDYLLHFPALGIKTTMLVIKPTYSSTDETLNYLRWKFQSDSGNKWSMTDIMILTGTSSNPIPPILIDNPNPDAPVNIDVMVVMMTEDNLNDTSAFIYISGIAFDDVHTFNETNSGILAFFNTSDELVGTVNISDIVNITRVGTDNRIVIDDSSENNIILDFATEYDTLQALSAINWVLLDPATRLLPQPADIVSPVIVYTSAVISSELLVDLSDYSTNFTKQNFIDVAILSITDARDGVMVAQISDIAFAQGTVLYNSITAIGSYTATVTITDIAGNTTTENITLTVSA